MIFEVNVNVILTRPPRIYNNNCAKTCFNRYLYPCTNFLQNSGAIFAHPSMRKRSSSSMFLGFLLRTLLFNSCHKFSAGFKSGDCEGQSKTLISFSLNQLTIYSGPSLERANLGCVYSHIQVLPN